MSQGNVLIAHLTTVHLRDASHIRLREFATLVHASDADTRLARMTRGTGWMVSTAAAQSEAARAGLWSLTIPSLKVQGYAGD